MDGFIKYIFTTPISTTLVMAGVCFIIVAVVGKIAPWIDIQARDRIIAGGVGVIFLAIGLYGASPPLPIPPIGPPLLADLVKEMSQAHRTENYDKAISYAEAIIDKFGTDAEKKQEISTSFLMNKILEKPGGSIFSKNLNEPQVQEIHGNAPLNEVAYAWFVLGDSFRKKDGNLAKYAYFCCIRYKIAMVYDHNGGDPIFWQPSWKCQNRLEYDYKIKTEINTNYQESCNYKHLLKVLSK